MKKHGFDNNPDRNCDISPAFYLIILAIGRAYDFEGMGNTVASNVQGAKFSLGKIKTIDRIYAKCSNGGDYHIVFMRKEKEGSQWLRNVPNPVCQVLDVVRGYIVCDNHRSMEQAYFESVRVFGHEPFVRKDRRREVQRDVLLIFRIGGLYVELQLHLEQTLAVKALMHPVFELQRVQVSYPTDTNPLAYFMDLEGSGFFDLIDPGSFSAGAASVKVTLTI